MANERLLLGWQQQARQVKTIGSEATGYAAANALTEDLTEIWRSSDLTSEGLDFRLGKAVLGQDLGGPSSGAPTSEATRIKVDPTGQYAFVVDGGTLSVYPYNATTGGLGAELAGRSGTSITTVRDVDVMQSGTMLYVVLAGDSAGVAGYEVYPFNPATGTWGSRYSNGASTVDANMHSCAWVGTGDFVVGGPDSSDFLWGHPFSTATGIGTKYTDAASAPSAICRAIAVANFSGTYVIAAAYSASPYLSAWAFTPSSGFGAKHTNPTALAGSARSIAATANVSGTIFIAVGHDTSPFVSVLPLSTSAWSTKLANPSTLPSAAGYGVAFRGGDAFLAMAQDAAASPLVYAFSTGGGGSIGAQHTRFVPAAASGGRAVAFPPDGRFLLYGHSTTPYFGVLPFTATAVTGSVDAICILNTNLTSAAQIRIRIGNDATFAATNYDSGTIAFYPSGVTEDTFDAYPREGKFVLPSNTAGDYMRLDFTDAANLNGYLEVGLVGVYPAFQPAVNFDYGATVSVQPLTRETGADSGRFLHDVRRARRGLTVTLQFASEAEMRDYLHALAMMAPYTKVLALPFPTDTGKLNYLLGLWGVPRFQPFTIREPLNFYTITLLVEEQF